MSRSRVLRMTAAERVARRAERVGRKVRRERRVATARAVVARALAEH